MPAAQAISINPPRPPVVDARITGNELLLLATKRFCKSGDGSRLGADQFKEAFHSLVAMATSETLTKVSKLLSDNPYAPRDIVLYLATEPISIATPILRLSQRISQLDMVQIIAKFGLSHARELATRADLGPSVIKCLARLDDKAVTMALENNQAINFRAPKKSEPVRITAPAAEIREFQASPNINVRISKPSRTIASAPAEPAKKAETELLAAAARGGRLPQKPAGKTKPTRKITARTARAPQIQTADDFGGALEKCALAKSRQGMAALMQKRFNLALETCHHVLEDDTGDTLAVLMKTTGMAAQTANRIALLTFPAIGLSVQNATRAVRFYSSLSQEDCKKAVAQWPKHSNRSAVHQPHLQETELDRRQTATTAPGRGQNVRDGRSQHLATG